MSSAFSIHGTMRYFQDTNGIWVGFIEEIPGVNSQGGTLQELKENLAEAAQMVIEVNRSLIQEEIGTKNIHEEHIHLALSNEKN